MPLMTVLVVVALVVGVVLGFWIQANKSRPAQGEVERLRQSEMELRTTIARLEAEKKAVQGQWTESNRALEAEKTRCTRAEADLMSLREQVAQLSTALEKERQSAQEKLDLLEGKFKLLADDILKKRAREFDEWSERQIGHLLDPVREKFGEFKDTLESLKTQSTARHSELKTQIEGLRTLNERLTKDAENLVNALKGSSKTQGDWGELVLEQLLEAAGLQKGHEYFVQESFDREDGKRSRPDVILNLPGGRQVVIDSKVSLLAYSEYCSGGDDEVVREGALKRHLASIRAHIKGLSQKNYHALYGLKSLDFVILFVPIEPAFTLAMANDGRLWQDAWDQNVLFVSRTTLLFVLRTIAYLWGQERQTRNIEKIVRRGGELYEKLASFTVELTNVGRSLDAARQSYDEAMKKLSTGRGNVIRQAEMLRDLGIKPSKNIPTPLVEAAMETLPELSSPLLDQETTEETEEDE
jgi:DNA recombination protein RmuC